MILHDMHDRGTGPFTMEEDMQIIQRVEELGLSMGVAGETSSVFYAVCSYVTPLDAVFLHVMLYSVTLG